MMRPTWVCGVTLLTLLHGAASKFHWQQPGAVLWLCLLLLYGVPALCLQDEQQKSSSVGEAVLAKPRAMSRDPSREIRRLMMSSFLGLLPLCVFFSCFTWAPGLGLVLRTPRILLEAAFLYKLGTELVTRDWKSGRQSWLDMLRRTCSFTAACFGLAVKNKAECWVPVFVYVIPLFYLRMRSDGGESPEQNWSAPFYSAASWGMWNWDHPSPHPAGICMAPNPVLLNLFPFQQQLPPFLKVPVLLWLI